MKNLFVTASGTLPFLMAGAAAAQSERMMNHDMWSSGGMGAYGVYWVPVLLIVVVGLVAWIIMQKRKR